MDQNLAPCPGVDLLERPDGVAGVFADSPILHRIGGSVASFRSVLCRRTNRLGDLIPHPHRGCSGEQFDKTKKTLRMAPKGLDKIHNIVRHLWDASEAIPNATKGSGLFPLDCLMGPKALTYHAFSLAYRNKPIALPS